jgi:hypothetical protein
MPSSQTFKSYLISFFFTSIFLHDLTSDRLELNDSVKGKKVCHEGIWESGGIAPLFLTSTLDGGQCSASHLCHFTPGEGSPAIHCIRGWVGTIAGLDVMEKRKISCS